MNAAPQLTPAQKRWGLAAAVPFLLSILLLGIALNTGHLVAFAIGWPLLMAFGYSGSLQMAKGDLAHPLFKTQVILHFTVLVLLVALLVRSQ